MHHRSISSLLSPGEDGEYSHSTTIICRPFHCPACATSSCTSQDLSSASRGPSEARPSRMPASPALPLAVPYFAATACLLGCCSSAADATGRLGGGLRRGDRAASALAPLPRQQRQSHHDPPTASRSTRVSPQPLLPPPPIPPPTQPPRQIHHSPLPSTRQPSGALGPISRHHTHTHTHTHSHVTPSPAASPQPQSTLNRRRLPTFQTFISAPGAPAHHPPHAELSLARASSPRHSSRRRERLLCCEGVPR